LRRWLTALLVEHHQRLAAQAGVALLDPYIAAEGCLFLLVPDFQGRRLDVDRLIAVREKPCKALAALATLSARAQPSRSTKIRSQAQ
jgi:hypothetical protein